jgi:hypothetical protein
MDDTERFISLLMAFAALETATHRALAALMLPDIRLARKELVAALAGESTSSQFWHEVDERLTEREDQQLQAMFNQFRPTTADEVQR